MRSPLREQRSASPSLGGRIQANRFSAISSCSSTTVMISSTSGAERSSAFAGTCTKLDPTFAVPLRMLGRLSHLERVSRWLARRDQELQVRLARELVTRCRSLTRAIVELDRELEQRTAETAPALLELPGCAAVPAAKPLAEIGPSDRFRSDAQLARHGGVAPLEASSGRVQRHRLDRGGNRQLNAALYRVAITQARYHPAARAYLERKQAEGKSRREAIRCLKRLLVRVVFNTLKASPALT